jgi:hypothetical protein
MFLASNWRQRFDFDFNLVEFGTGDQGGHVTFVDLQIDNGTFTHVGTTAREAVFKIAVGFEVVAPSLAPKCGGNLSTVQHHR